MARKTWAQQMAAQIKDDAKSRYGAGWAHMSEDARDNYIASRLLALVMTQIVEAFEPAQAMVRNVRAELEG